jgi:hypothetical protein
MSDASSPARKRRSPARDWPLWRVVGAGLFLYGAMAVFLVGTFLLPPAIPSPSLLVAIPLAIVPLGVILTLWSWRSYTYYSRLASLFVIAACILLVSFRSWAAILSGFWFWLVTGLTMVAFLVSWALPSISYSTSSAIRRELGAPRTRLGRGVLKWTLLIGLGGVGALGAGVGMSLARSGALGLAHLLIAALSMAMAILFSLSMSNQLWPDRPWGRDSGSREASRRP